MVIYVFISSCSQCFICFLDVCCKCVYLDIAYVSHICLQVFYLDVAYVCNGFQTFLGVFSCVSQACFKYFIYLQTYVASVASECFKSISGVAHEMHMRSGRGHERSPCGVRRRWRRSDGCGPLHRRVKWSAGVGVRTHDAHIRTDIVRALALSFVLWLILEKYV